VIAGLLAADVAFAYQQTSIVPAIHDVKQSLGASPEWAAWLVTVYLIVATIATPAMGRLADLHGRRRMLLTGLGVFLAGSRWASARCWRRCRPRSTGPAAAMTGWAPWRWAWPPSACWIEAGGCWCSA
jgi:MFS family permease